MEETHAQLDKTVVLMKEVVGGATSQIYMVQSNVTQQLATMGQSLGETVAMLNSAVDAARTTIHFEVSSVKSDIEQYVAVTNKQFAAENDFVKYQLAGKLKNKHFSLLQIIRLLSVNRAVHSYCLFDFLNAHDGTFKA